MTSNYFLSNSVKSHVKKGRFLLKEGELSGVLGQLVPGTIFKVLLTLGTSLASVTKGSFLFKQQCFKEFVFCVTNAIDIPAYNAGR